MLALWPPNLRRRGGTRVGLGDSGEGRGRERRTWLAGDAETALVPQGLPGVFVHPDQLDRVHVARNAGHKAHRPHLVVQVHCAEKHVGVRLHRRTPFQNATLFSEPQLPRAERRKVLLVVARLYSPKFPFFPAPLLYRSSPGFGRRELLTTIDRSDFGTIASRECKTNLHLYSQNL